MRFRDASAIVPLIIDEPRRERDGTLPTASVSAAVERVRRLERAWHQHQVAPTDTLRQRAQRLLEAAQREGLCVEPA